MPIASALFALKKILAALLLPPFGLLLLALIGLGLMRARPRPGRTLAALALFALTALTLPPVADALMHGLETAPPISREKLARAQAIVILGGGAYPDAPEYDGDTVSGPTLERLRYGVHLQRSSGLPILVSGGAPFGGRPEGESMKEAIERDFGGRVRWVENASRDTAENAAYTVSLLKTAGVSRIALVSHSGHLPRAIALFERQGIEVFAAPTGFARRPPSALAQALPSATAFGRSCEALREWLGLLALRLAQ